MSRSRLNAKKTIGPFDAEVLAICGLCIGSFLLLYGGQKPATGDGSGFINAWTIAGGIVLLVSSFFGVCFDDKRRIAQYSSYAKQRVSLMEKSGRISEALDEQEELLRVFPDWVWGWLVQSRLLAKSGRLDAALSAARKASELSPDAPIYLASQALLALRMKDEASARCLVGRLTAEFPDTVISQLFAAELEAETGNRDKSLELAKLALAVDTWASYDWLVNGVALTEVGRLLEKNDLFEGNPDSLT